VANEQPVATGDDGSVVEHFRPTSGRFTGAVVVTVAGVVAVLSLLDPSEVVPEVGVGAILVGLLGWAVTLRPRVSLVGDFLILRGVFSTTAIPLAGIEELAVRQLTAVRAGDKRYTSSAIGQSRRALMKAGRPPDPAVDGPAIKEPSYADYVEDRIRQRVDDQLAVNGVRRGSPEQIELGSAVLRQPAWPEILTVAVATVALVVALIL
jgi:hypothetical protein